MNGSDAAVSALAEAMLEHEEDALVVLRAVRDDSGDIVDFVHELVNRAAEQNAQQSLLGRRQLEVYPAEAGSMFEEYRRLLLTGQVLHREVEAETADPATSGRTYQVYARPVGSEFVVCQYRDITQLRAVQRALKEQALHDPLTGLANRRLLVDHLEQALARLHRRPSLLALLYCDLDEFKEVNDTYGHLAGDELLQQVAARLLGAVRPEDTVARLGGDEFVVLSEGLPDDAQALSLATRVQREVAGTYSLQAGEPSLGVSVGVATTGEVVSPEDLLERADSALYDAKRGGEDPPVALR